MSGSLKGRVGKLHKPVMIMIIFFKASAGPFAPGHLVHVGPAEGQACISHARLHIGAFDPPTQLLTDPHRGFGQPFGCLIDWYFQQHDLASTRWVWRP